MYIMSQSGPDRAKAARAARQAKADAEARLADELASRRVAKLTTAASAVEQFKQLLGSVREQITRADDLASHLRGFYEEIDKLAKGRSLLAATDLGVEQANAIVREAKKLIGGDPHLDRVKELVPAGDNPVYPDVLITARAVQQSLERLQVRLTTQKQRIVAMLSEAKTIQAALQYYSEYKAIPSMEEVTATLEGKAALAWFETDALRVAHFNMARLDHCNLDEYLSVARASEADAE